ncbi:transcription initiation factor TFIID subunit A-domain-containing protein [Pterulicium gracile]|uniref:TBP-associated factor 12 n=1 Tax=Pterulicium gracile TaxID=1884261 RepID=A0A5C3QKS9_9AGAR|nr:transcription initiation factor TFIID subunit A-domain-containing protein [Pterula gracilis]
MSTPNSTPPAAASIITALGQAFKSQTGDPMTPTQISQLILANMAQLGDLAKAGKLNQAQIAQLKEFAERTKAAHSNAFPRPMPRRRKRIQPTAQVPTATAFKSNSPGPLLTSAPFGTEGYPVPQTLNVANPGPVSWPASQTGRPTLSGGIPGGRVAGTPSQVARAADDVNLTLDDNRGARKRNTPGDQSMRRSIQDLVSSIDPNVKVDPEVEELLLNIADEFIDSVTNFSCRLAKHRGGDTLDVKDLQLHLERNHNIRIPGFSSDDTRVSLAQPTIAPPVNAASSKKGAGGGTHMTLRSHRQAQVQQAKREGKLV